MNGIAIQNNRSPVSQVPGIGKKDALYLWSAYRFKTGDTMGKTYSLFNVIQGTQAGQGFATPLTARETSIISTPGSVPLDQKWECWDMAVDFIGGGTLTDGAFTSTVPVSAAQAAELVNKLQIVFIRGGTQVVQLGPASLYPSGGGVQGGDMATTDVANNGFNSAGARRRLGRNVKLNPGDTWTMAFLLAGTDDDDLALGTGAFVDARLSFWMYRDLGLSG